MKDIQAIITKRAEEKLNKDIRSYFEQIKGNPLFSVVRNLKIIHPNRSGEEKQTEFDDFFYAGGDSWSGHRIFYQAMHDKYVEDESAIFMSEFDRLKDDLDSLISQ